MTSTGETLSVEQSGADEEDTFDVSRSVFLGSLRSELDAGDELAPGFTRFRGAYDAVLNSYQDGDLTKKEVAELLSRLKCLDVTGREWTIGATSGSWYRKGPERWLRSGPPVASVGDAQAGPWEEVAEQYQVGLAVARPKAEEGEARPINWGDDQQPGLVEREPVAELEAEELLAEFLPAASGDDGVVDQVVPGSYYGEGTEVARAEDTATASGWTASGWRPGEEPLVEDVPPAVTGDEEEGDYLARFDEILSELPASEEP